MEVSGSDRCYVYGGVVDLRKGAPGLCGLVGKPEEDALYLFSNRRRNLLKFLSVDKWGTWVGTRRLHHNHFETIRYNRANYEAGGTGENGTVEILQSDHLLAASMQSR